MSEHDSVLFQPRRPPPFLSVPSAVFVSSLLVALKRAGLLVTKQGCRLADSSSSSRNEYYLGGIIALLLQDHRTMSMKSVCSSQYMVTDQH